MEDRQRRFDRRRRAGRGLQVADVRLDRSDAGGRAAFSAHQLAERLDLHLVADVRGRSMALKQVHRARIDASVLIGTTQRPLLTFGVGRSHALALAVGARADAADHRVHAVPVPHRVGEALEHDDAAALAHHKAVRGLVERTRTLGGQRPDLGELRVGGRRHGAVGTTADRHVKIAVLQALDRGLDRGHRPRARRVGGEIRAAEVERVGDAPGGDVGELAGHGIFGDRRQRGFGRLLKIREDLGLLISGERAELRDLAQRLAERREERPDRVLVGDLAAHGLAEDDGDALAVKIFGGAVAGVFQRIGGRFKRDLLYDVDQPNRRRRDAEPARVEGKIGDEPTDLGVGLVRHGVIRAPIQRRVPTVGRDLDDPAPSFQEPLPKLLGAARAGQTTADADDRDRLLRVARARLSCADRARSRRACSRRVGSC